MCSAASGAYLLGGDHNSNFFDCLCEFVWLDSAVVVEIEVLECLEEDRFFAGKASSLLRQLGLQSLFKAIDALETTHKKNRKRNHSAVCASGEREQASPAVSVQRATYLYLRLSMLFVFCVEKFNCD